MERKAKVVIFRARMEPRAECDQCESLHPESTRQRVRQHVQTTGHRARVVVEDITVYRPER